MNNLINFVKEHGQEARKLISKRIVDGKVEWTETFQVLDVWTYEGIEFSSWVSIEPSLYAVKEWLGY